MQGRILVVFTVAMFFLSFSATADTISKPECVAITTEQGGCISGWVINLLINNCKGKVVAEGTAVSGQPLSEVSEGRRGAFNDNRSGKYEHFDSASLAPSEDKFTTCYRPGSLRLTVAEVNGGGSAKKNAEQQGKGGVVAKNNFRSSIDYEIYSGQYDGCDPSRDQYIASGSLNSDSSLRLDCKMNNDTQRVGYCYRWKDKRESSFGSWSGFVCPRSDRPDSKRNF